jgi:hypothetical protein
MVASNAGLLHDGQIDYNVPFDKTILADTPIAAKVKYA